MFRYFFVLPLAVLHVQDKIRSPLRLAAGDHNQPLVVLQRFQPVTDIAYAVLELPVDDPGHRVQVAGTDLGDEFLHAVSWGSELGGLRDALAPQPATVPGTVHQLMEKRAVVGLHGGEAALLGHVDLVFQRIVVCLLLAMLDCRTLRHAFYDGLAGVERRD